MAAVLKLSTFGGLSIELGGEPLSDLTAHKVQALLVYLAYKGRAQRREALAELLWQDRSQERAMGNLRVALTSLRKALEDFVLITRDTIAIDPDAPVLLDAAEFEGHLAAGRTQEAIALYQGDFLDGFYLREARGFERWVSEERERLKVRAMDALSDQVAHDLQGGDFENGIDNARRLLELDPLMEEAHCQLMRLLAASGNRGAALRQYETCQKALADELGVEPSEETQALYEQIQSGRLDRPAPSLLPMRGYELRERIGAGGFGEVYRAYQPSVDRQVAIKIILPKYANNPEFIRRFENEAQMVARLEHMNIVPLYDYWRDQDGAYLVMRWLRGGNLSQALERGPWSMADAALLLDQIAGALDAAHRRNIVHRDVKPENILFDEDGNAYLTDFGISKDLIQPSNMTQTGEILGTWMYLSPEQAQSRPVTPQSDLYSLGVVLYEVLTGEHPFSEETPVDMLIKSTMEPLPPLRWKRPELPEALEKVIQRATAKHPPARYPDVLSLAEAFRQAVSTQVSAAVGPAAAAVGQAEPAPEVEPKVGIVPQPPAFLSEEGERAGDRPIFVARQRELGRLDGYLQKALKGQGGVVFVTGGPGRGKTALVEEFARQSVSAYRDLLVAMGVCNAYSEIGDPYLPWREILNMLCGDVEARWAAGKVSTEGARRLWSAMPHMARALVQRGPHLFETFVPGETLLSHLMIAARDDRELLDAMRDRIARRRGGGDGLEQSHLFEQYTNVLRAVADEQPLLLLLDDLQWADESSISLLFHLGRRLEGTRVLIACTYRPEEVALDRAGERHPLEKVLAEFKRQFGEVWINLSGEDVSEGRIFVDALLDSQPNRLDRAFREALYRHTAGHPLFTIELLRAMQERGDLAQDDSGVWIEEQSIDWERLPARVEAVIEERFARLGPGLREVLNVASVEGVDFTVQALARVQGIEERELMRLLSRELEMRHRLVNQGGVLAVGRRRLSRYMFAHALFQQYLYHRLSEGERLLLHHEIGGVLEELYAGYTEEIAGQLARHFAGDPERERQYAYLAGERAARRYANSEALNYFNRALALTPEEDYQARYQMLLAREAVFDLLSDLEAQKEDLEELKILAESLKGSTTDPGRAEVAARWANYTSHIDYQASGSLAQQTVSLAEAEGRLDIAGQAYYIWSNALSIQGEFEDAIAQAEKGIAIAREIDDRRGESHLLNIMGLIALDLKDPAAARDYFERSLAISQEVNDSQLGAQSLNNLGNAAGIAGDYQAALEHYQQALAISREVGDRRREALVLGNLAWVASILGDFDTAKAYFEEQNRILVEIGARYMESFALINLSGLALSQMELDGARRYAEQGLALSREVGSRPAEAWALTFLGNAEMEMGDLVAAEGAYRSALEIRRDLDQPNLATEPQAGLAQVALALGDIPSAMSHIDQILEFLDSGGSLEGTEEPLRVYLACYQVLEAGGDPRKGPILDTAHQTLQARAAKIEDDVMRRRFLDNIPHHRQIVAAWEASRSQD